MFGVVEAIGLLILASIAVPLLDYLKELYSTASRDKSLSKASKYLPIRRYSQYHLLNGYDVLIRAIGWNNSFRLLTNLTQLLRSTHKTFSIRIAGRTEIWTCEPELIKAVYSTNFSDWELSTSRQLAFRPVVGLGAFATNGKTWHHGRSLIRPAFQRTTIASSLTAFSQHFNDLVRCLPSDGRTIDLKPLLSLLALDNITDFLLGRSTNALQPNVTPEIKDFMAALEYGKWGITVRGALGPLRSLYYSPGFNRACAKLHRFVDNCVDQAYAEGSAAALKDQGAIDDDNIGAESNGKTKKFITHLTDNTNDRKIIRDQLASNLAAGFDTTGGLMTTVFWLLSHSPRVMTALRKSIASLEGLEPTYTQLKSLEYVWWILNEGKLASNYVIGRKGFQ